MRVVTLLTDAVALETVRRSVRVLCAETIAESLDFSSVGDLRRKFYRLTQARLADVDRRDALELVVQALRAFELDASAVGFATRPLSAVPEGSVPEDHPSTAILGRAMS